MVSPKHVCVIGAGVSGLAAAKAFSTRGHKVTICEQSADLGGVWEPSRSYPDVQTQSPKDLNRYTDRAMPASYPEWPTGPQVHAYLCEYAKSFGLERMLRLNTKVANMAPRADGGPGWTLTLSDTSTAISTREVTIVFRERSGVFPISSAVSSTSNAFSTFAPRSRCSRAGAQARPPGWRTASPRQ